MHTIIRLIISISMLLVLVIGCSRGYQPNIPVNSELPTISGGETGEEENVIRNLMTNYDIHNNPPSWETEFSDEGTDDFETTLLDCIAATYFDNGTNRYNYVLACDTKNSIEGFSTSIVGCIYKLSTADEPTVSPSVTIPDIYISDPDACELLEVNNTLFAWIFDQSDTDIEVYSWPIDPSSGDLGARTHNTTINGPTKVRGLAVTPTTSNSNYHLFACNPADCYIYVFDNYGNLIDTLGIPTTMTPVDVCVTRYSGSYFSDYWTVYVAAKNQVNFAGDSIYCFHWDGYDYTDYRRFAKDIDGVSDIFPYLISIDVQKVGIDGTYEAPSRQHHSGSVSVLMYSQGLAFKRIRQVNFGSTAEDYYYFDQEFDTQISHFEVLPESFAVCKQHYSSGGNTYMGYQYLLSDRDPDLNGGGGSQYNIKLYNNQQS